MKYLSIVLSEGLRRYKWWRAVRTPCLLRGLDFVHSRVGVAGYFFFLTRKRESKRGKNEWRKLIKEKGGNKGRKQVNYEKECALGEGGSTI